MVFFVQTWNTDPSDYFIMPQPEPTTQFLAFLLFGGMLWVLNRKDIKDFFKISRQIVIGTIATTAILTFLFLVNF